MLIIIDFCVKMKNMAKGIAIIREPAAKFVNSFFLSVTKEKSPNARVCFSVERRTILGKIKSIQGPVKLEIPKKVIIVEGMLILENKELRDLMDIKVFVETDADERLMRRIRRDMVERARSIESILSQYSETVKPMHEQFVEPSKKYADIIIPRGGENLTGISILQEHLNLVLNQKS